MSEAKQRFLEQSKTYWNPGITQAWQGLDIDLAIERRQGYFLYDMDGRRLIDVHLNNGTFNLGHRNPELVDTLNLATQRFDMGNHHYPSLAGTALAEALAAATPGDLQYTVYRAGNTELIDVAIKIARHAKQARKIVTIAKSHSEDSDRECIQVPANNLKVMEDVLRKGDVAAVMLETIPVSNGLCTYQEGYLQSIKALCERYDALYIADETQIGLMHTGELWAITNDGIQPDILLIGTSISGGLYPITCAIISGKHAGWLQQDGREQSSASGATELGCIVALKTLEICQRREVRFLVHHITDFIRSGLEDIKALHRDFFTGIRHNGLLMGLEFSTQDGAKSVMKHLYRYGVLAAFSAVDASVLQIKPGILMSQALAEELLVRMETAIGAARLQGFQPDRKRTS